MRVVMVVYVGIVQAALHVHTEAIAQPREAMWCLWELALRWCRELTRLGWFSGKGDLAEPEALPGDLPYPRLSRLLAQTVSPRLRRGADHTSRLMMILEDTIICYSKFHRESFWVAKPIHCQTSGEMALVFKVRMPQCDELIKTLYVNWNYRLLMIFRYMSLHCMAKVCRVWTPNSEGRCKASMIAIYTLGVVIT